MGANWIDGEPSSSWNHHAQTRSDETGRLKTLRDYAILDTRPEAAFDDLTRLAAHLCDVPVALLSFVDADRQWFKAAVGYVGTETPRQDSFCDEAIKQHDVFIVPDASVDVRFRNHPLVRPHDGIRFYAGAPLTAPSGHNVGTLCVIDQVPRTLESQQTEMLGVIARQIVDQLELRRNLFLLARDSGHVRLLSGVTMAAQSARSVEEAITAVFTEITAETGWPLGRLWMPQGVELSHSLPLQTCFAADTERGRRFSSVAMETSFLVPSVFVSRVLGAERAVLVEDVRRDSEFIRAHYVVDIGIVSAIAFPIRAGGRIVAVFEFFSDIPMKRDDALLTALTDLGGQLGPLIAGKQAEAHLIASELRYRELVENSVDLIAIHDMSGRITMANSAIARLLGFESGEEVVGLQLETVIPLPLKGEFGGYLRRVGEFGMAEGLMTVLTRGGKERVIEYRNTVHRGEPRLIHALGRDVTARVRAEREVARSEKRYRRLFENSLSAFFRTSVAGEIEEVNDAFVQMFGYSSMSETTAISAADLYHSPSDRERVLDRLSIDKQLQDVELQCRRKDGSLFWALLNVSLVEEERGTWLEGSLLDITSRKESEESAVRASTYDALTQLPNRSLLMDRLFQNLASSRRSRTRVAILFIDLDGFKSVNDSFGHAAGDWLLIQVAGRLQKVLRESDTVARQSGDEFVVMLTALNALSDPELVARKLLDTLQENFLHYEFGAIRVSASIGIAISTEEGEDAETLLCRADAAMYESKRSGSGKVKVWKG